ncbi:hypothetical protein D9613_003268 [Agrocybe pediades]|uniref:DUF7330 domain-containing protein n=1 Tax=Agrocybe pediades TaxID=84607 RepID=A0A8H4QQZ4_9AGAR|nr:hypothetical protein D9613_003268 [Agrocybe pediades]KAF9553813.1 hypothetical protein CPC08DRAFT_672821 [Agrocybe pediades]
MSSDRSTLSLEKSTLLGHIPMQGTHKVKYAGDSDWDFHVDAAQHSLDLSLILPHYRARHQPVDHRMSMLVANDHEPMKLKVCRNVPTSKFYLEVLAETSDVTVWIPSDFKGRIHASGKPSFSAGFVNRILQNVRINEHAVDETYEEDEVVIVTRGRISLRMWDVQTCSPENTHKESLKRLFGCSRRAPETAMDWDFLLKD